MMIGQRKPWETAFPDMAPMAVDTPQFALPPATPPAAPKPKVNWMGVLADALSGAAGQPGQYAQRMARERQEQSAFERGEQQYQRQRADALSDDERNYQQQISLADYKRANPDDDLTQYMNLSQNDPDPARRAIYQQKVSAMTAPPMMSAQGFDDAGNPVMRFFPRAPAQQAAPSAPVGRLTPIGGGAGPQVPRRFPY